MSGKRIIVHSLADALAALEAAGGLGQKAILASAAGAGCYAGPLWFKILIEEARAKFPSVEVIAILDCADEPGMVLAALRHGLKYLRFTGSAEALARLQDIAQAQDATIETGPAPPALDLLDREDALAACRAYLA